MTDLFYFAYGSNMDLKQMRSRVGYVNIAETYVLEDHRLTFNGGLYNAGFANIEEANGQTVEGVLYQLDDHQIWRLDGFEGWPNAYKKMYWNIDQGVAFAYYSVDNGFSHLGKRRFLPQLKPKPTLDYLNRIIDASFEHKLKKTYESLIDYKNANYTLKRKSIKKSL